MGDSLQGTMTERVGTFHAVYMGLGSLLDAIGFKRLSDAIFAANVTPCDRDYVIHRALWLLLREDKIDESLEIAERAWRFRKRTRVGRGLIHIYLRKRLYTRALDVALSLKQLEPENPWLSILPGDIMYFFIDDPDAAIDLYLEAYTVCKRVLPNKDPLAIVLKRLACIYRQKGDSPKLREVLEEFYAMGTPNFHDDEFIMLANERLKEGNRDGALKVLKEGLSACPKSAKIREALSQLGLDPGPYVPQKSGARSLNTATYHDSGQLQPTCAVAQDLTTVKKIPVQTRVVFEGDDIFDVIQQYVANVLQPGDIVTISSCVAGLAEGRMIMEGTVRCGFLANLISRFVKGRHVGRFQATTPMANPLSVQTLLEEVGSLRVILAVIAGAISKPFGINGWFYRVAGPQSALIDDIMGSIPPYDYYVIMGPLESTKLSRTIVEKLKCRGAAVIDANDLGVAWTVGYWGDLDPRKLQRDLADNPAGNQDQRTPIVIVRPS